LDEGTVFMKPLVTLFNPMLHPAGHEWLAARADVELIPQGASPSGLIEAISRADAALVRPPVRMTRELIAAAPYLRVIGTEGTGYDQIDVAAATDAGIPVIHNVGIGAVPVAEHTVGLMLALARRITQGNDRLRRDGWSSRASFFGQGVGTELTGKTLGIIGFGQIGRRVANICHAGFGMRVVAYTRSPGEARTDAPEVDFRADLHSVMAEADFLTIHTPLNEGTRHLIGEAELALMKRTAFLINCARGPIIDQAALVAALRDRRIAGAGLDVFEPEPADLSDPLFEQDHVVVTPHIAALSEETNRLLALGAAQQVMQVLAGTRPPRLVNPEVWERRRLGRHVVR
jgi:D-3-phosphoglycerate dehydrogenase